MENLNNVYYLIQLMARHILMFIREFIFRELAWFTPTSKDLDNANSKVRNITPQHSADFLIFFAICGFLFAFMILSASTPKNEASRYDASNMETISMAFEEDPSSWYPESSSTNLMNCFHACGDSIDPSRDIVSGVQDLSCLPICKNASPRSRTSSHNVRQPGQSQRIKKRRINHPVSQKMPQEWLIRRTRSGHIYGKYLTERE